MRSTAAGASWTLQLDATRPRTYTVQASLAALPNRFVPASVRADSKTVGFSYDPATRVLRVTARIGARGHLEVRG